MLELGSFIAKCSATGAARTYECALVPTGHRMSMSRQVLSPPRADSDSSDRATHCDPVVRLNSFPSSSYFIRRILLLTALLTSELTIVSIILAQHSYLVSTTHDWLIFILRYSVAFIGCGSIVVTWNFLKNKTPVAGIDYRTETDPIRWGLFALHFLAAIVFAKLCVLLYYQGGLRRLDIVAAGWVIAGIGAIAFGALTFLSWPVWRDLLRETGRLWAYGSIAIVSAMATGPYFRWLWDQGPATDLTFRLTKLFLSPFVFRVVSDPLTKTIGTPLFRVQILSACSGIEGVGLIIAFATLWLVVFRRECRFPRSLILIPTAAALIFVLNSLRITILILIGDAGSPQIALHEFHSEAGWFAVSAVCVGFCFMISRVSWFTTRERGFPSTSIATSNPTLVFLLPFLMITAAGMVSGGGKAGFEWLYPLRFFAAAGALWIFRRGYGALGWGFDWVGPAIGAVVFLIWIVVDGASHTSENRDLFAALMVSPAAARNTWIIFRVLGAVITVPLAEELAFRGFLMRRLISADFESVSLRQLSWFALLFSSVAFGLLHGNFWIAGTLGGVLFGLAMIRRGRIGDAVIAHATTNALLAAYVLIFHDWHLWY